MRRPIQRRIQDRILAVRCIARVSGLTTSLGKKQSATAAHRAYADRLRPHARAARANKQLCRAESFNDPQAADTSNGIRACLLRAQMLLVFGPIRMIRKHRAPPNSPVVLARGRAQPGASRLVNPLTRRRHARCRSLLPDTPSVAAAGAPRRSRGTQAARSTLERRWADAKDVAPKPHRLNCGALRDNRKGSRLGTEATVKRIVTIPYDSCRDVR